MSLDNLIDPGGERVEHLAAHLRVGATGSHRDMEGVVGAFVESQARATAEPPGERLELVEGRERIARALQKEHRDVDREQVLAALVRWPSGRVQRKAEEDEPAHAG